MTTISSKGCCFNMIITTGKTTTVSLHPNRSKAAVHSCAKHYYPSFKLVHCISHPAIRSPKITSERSHILYRQDGDAASKKVPLMAVSDRRRTRNRVISCKASKFPTLFVYPPMTSKPKWWWRSFACTPYLLPLHLMWFHADSAYRLHPLMENWEFLVNPFLDTISLMPNWIMMALMFAAYYLVVRRKEWPHFFRFHVIMAMLLENGYQALAIACGWLPKTLYRGKLGATFWLALAVAQLFTVAECMTAALSGKYADLPWASDAAYIHSDLDLF